MLVSAVGKFNKIVAVQSTFKSMPKDEQIKIEPLQQPSRETSAKLDLIA